MFIIKFLSQYFKYKGHSLIEGFANQNICSGESKLLAAKMKCRTATGIFQASNVKSTRQRVPTIIVFEIRRGTIDSLIRFSADSTIIGPTKEKIGLWPFIFEPTCAHARCSYASLCVCLSVTRPKFITRN